MKDTKLYHNTILIERMDNGYLVQGFTGERGVASRGGGYVFNTHAQLSRFLKESFAIETNEGDKHES